MPKCVMGAWPLKSNTIGLEAFFGKDFTASVQDHVNSFTTPPEYFSGLAFFHLGISLLTQKLGAAKQ